MFAKLLKHDCRAMFKHWWVAAVSSILFSIIAGVCLNIVTVSYTTHYSIQTVAYILLIFSFIAIFIFPVLSAVLMFKRFNKNFFSDEGYLTFTLPVSKSALLSSKLLTGVIFAVASTMLFGIDLIITATTSGENFFEIMEDIFEILIELFSYEFYVSLTIVLLYLALLASIATSTAFIFLCITLANMLVKKRKLLTGLGIFYGVQIVFTIFLRTIITSGALELIDFTFAEESTHVPFIALGILAIIVIFGAGIYLLNLYLLDKKLNLE